MKGSSPALVIYLTWNPRVYYTCCLWEEPLRLRLPWRLSSGLQMTPRVMKLLSGRLNEVWQGTRIIGQQCEAGVHFQKLSDTKNLEIKIRSEERSVISHSGKTV